MDYTGFAAERPNIDNVSQTEGIPVSIGPIMNCHDLARRIQRLQPDAELRDVARLCLLLANNAHDIEQLADDRALARIWKEIHLRMQANADQHAAMTEELENLALSDPKKFSSDQIWVLIRAIKVQGQILQMYIGDEALTV